MSYDRKASNGGYEPILITEEQEYIMKRFSTLIGKVLTLVEISTPAGQQYNSLKRELQEALYNARNDVLTHFTGVVPEDESNRGGLSAHNHPRR